MNINNYDKSITNDEIISKADNTYIMLMTSIMTKNIERVDHKIGDTLYSKYENEINQDKLNNVIHMFDELNVKSTEILNIREDDNKIIVNIKLVSRFLNYYLDEQTKEFLKGNRETREEHTNILTFEKLKNAKELKSVRFCPSCGHSMDISYTGVCEYCGSIYNTEKFDYVLIDLKEENV